MEFTKWVDEQSKVVKILLFIPIWGWVFGFLYRLFEFIEHKETASLVGFILCVAPFVGFVMSILDLVFICIDGKLKFFVISGENFGISGTVNGNSDNSKTEESESNTSDKEEE